VRLGDETVVAVETVEVVPDLPPRVRVLLPLIKGERMDDCIEKLVEVGVDELVVWPAERSIVRLGDKKLARLDRYRATAKAAARQSGRASVPAVVLSNGLADALATLPEGSRVLLDPGADRGSLLSASDITIVSGPEGGFTPAEIDACLDAGFLSIGLGPRTLRAETAPVVAVALVRAATAS
jgi:16S rRNA (uracil1498-N3)-methyltransferase